MGFSETARQLPDTEDYTFLNGFAGVKYGNVNFGIRTEIIGNKIILKRKKV
jgi:hypothetical protein